MSSQLTQSEPLVSQHSKSRPHSRISWASMTNEGFAEAIEALRRDVSAELQRLLDALI